MAELNWLTGLIGLPLAVMAVIALLNGLTFPRLKVRPTATGRETPRVSLLTPARNEARVIEGCVRGLLGQHYPHFEVVILDDHSTDETATLAQQAAGADPRFRLLTGRPLPAGWLGKAWACQQLGEAAAGELLIFTDADVVWTPAALNAIVALWQQEQADLLSVWPTQDTVTWSERLVVPLMAFVILAYLPVWGVHHLPLASLAAANGQCLVFSRSAYHALGGHTRVRGELLDDVTLARHIKRAGRRLRLADAAGLIQCRMYHNWAEVRRGFAKNIAAGYGGGPGLLLATLFHWVIFWGPWVWLALGRGSLGWPWQPLALALGGVGLRAFTAWWSRQRPWDALALPLSVALMTLIAFQSLLWLWRGAGEWKGRPLMRPPL